MTFNIPIPEKISFNRLYAGVPWPKRKEWVHDMHLMVMAQQIEPWTGDFPVNVSYHFKLHGKPLDSSNAYFLAKLVEDGLVRSGFIPDDSREYVKWNAVLADKVAKDLPQEVVIHISPAFSTVPFAENE